MCHAIVEVRYRTDLTDAASDLARAKDEEHLAEIVNKFKNNDQTVRIRVYRPDARWDRVESWVFEE